MEIAYPVVVWLAGSRTVDVPGPLLLLAGGGVDSIPAQQMTVTVASILPAGVPDSLLQIQPAAQAVVRGERTLRPLIGLVDLGGARSDPFLGDPANERAELLQLLRQLVATVVHEPVRLRRPVG